MGSVFSSGPHDHPANFTVGTTTPFENPLDTKRVETYAAYHGKQGIAEGFVPSIVAGQLQLSFTAGATQERSELL